MGFGGVDLEIGNFNGIMLTMSKGTEIERKFLVKNLPESLEEGVMILQGYLHIGSDGSEIRVRRKGDKYFMTKKSGGDLQRKEEESQIDEKEFYAEWPKTEGKRVEKTRFEIPFGGQTIELDLFAGSLEGLMTAEVEFASIEASQSFTPPEFLGQEVTSDKRYKNQKLALYGIPI